MKPYQTYSALDFACDEDFLNWVKYTDRYPYLDKFWQNWLEENPEKQEVIDEARSMILAVLHEIQFTRHAGQEEIWQ